MKQLLETLDLALEALEESIDLVREDYENAKKLYSNYPSRQARLIGLEDGLSKHEAAITAITAIKQARSAPVQDSTCSETLRAQGKAYPRTCRKCGLGPCIGAPKQPPAAPVQEPVALDVTLDGEEAKLLRDMLGDDRDELSPVRLLVGNGHSGHGLYAAHAEYQEEGAILLAATTPPAAQPVQKPAIKQGWDVDTLLDKPAAQRQWVGLTDEDKLMCWARATHDADVEHKTEHQCLMDYGTEIEAKLEEKNT